MSVTKKIHIQGISIISFDDAIKNALEETALTIDHIFNLKVVGLYCNIKDKTVQEYIADTEISFKIDKENHLRKERLYATNRNQKRLSGICR